MSAKKIKPLSSSQGSSSLLDAADRASSEILSRLGLDGAHSSQSAPPLDLQSAGLLSSDDKSERHGKANNIQYDSLQQLRAALGNKSVMAEPHLSDLFLDGNTPAGEAEDEEVLLRWMDHIDSIIRNSLETDLEVDVFDMSTLLIRKATLFCALGKLEESVACAKGALDLVVTAQGFFRLACAHYLLCNYTEALDFILQANSLERYNPHIENVLLVILLRLRSRKDRAEAVILNYS